MDESSTTTTAGRGPAPATSAPSETPTTTAITVRGLRMAYGDHEVVRGIDLDIAAGEVFAFLGPNGAGKTTTVEILEGFRRRTGGEVTRARRGTLAGRTASGGRASVWSCRTPSPNRS